MKMLGFTATMFSLDKLKFITFQESAKPVGITGGGWSKNQMSL